MPEVAAAIAATGRTLATFLHRPAGRPVDGIFQAHDSVGSIEPAIARIAGRQHTVKHVDAGGNTGQQVFRLAYTHEVTGLVC